MSTKLVKVRALHGFIIAGREPAQPGEVLDLPTHFVIELENNGKVERYVEPQPAPVDPAPADKPDASSKTLGLSKDKASKTSNAV